MLEGLANQICRSSFYGIISTMPNLSRWGGLAFLIGEMADRKGLSDLRGDKK